MKTFRKMRFFALTAITIYNTIHHAEEDNACANFEELTGLSKAQDI